MLIFSTLCRIRHSAGWSQERQSRNTNLSPSIYEDMLREHPVHVNLISYKIESNIVPIDFVVGQDRLTRGLLFVTIGIGVCRYI